MIISDIEVEVLHKDVKNMNLRVYPADRKVKMSVPRGLSDTYTHRFLEERAPWLKKQLARFQKKPVQRPMQFTSGENIWVWGKKCILKVVEAHKPPIIFVEGNTLRMQVRPGTTVTKRALLLKEWYRAELKKAIPPLIEQWESIMKVHVHEFGVKLMKTRWGTCNIRDHRIWLNLELAKKRPEMLEYVVVHEMVHLLERLHSKRFYRLMSTFLPNWASLKNELNGKSTAKDC